VGSGAPSIVTAPNAAVIYCGDIVAAANDGVVVVVVVVVVVEEDNFSLILDKQGVCVL